MKKPTLAITVVILVSGFLSTGCSSSGKRMEDYRENIQYARDDLKEAKKQAILAAQQSNYSEEWAAFRKSTLQKIVICENRIDKLRQSLNMTGRSRDADLEKRIDTLEMRNREMKARIDSYQENQGDWASFKTAYSNEMNALTEAVNNCKVNQH